MSVIISSESWSEKKTIELEHVESRLQHADAQTRSPSHNST